MTVIPISTDYLQMFKVIRLLIQKYGLSSVKLNGGSFYDTAPNLFDKVMTSLQQNQEPILRMATF